MCQWKAQTHSYIGKLQNHNVTLPVPVWPQVVDKTPKFGIFSANSTQKGEVSIEQWAFEVKSVMQIPTEVTLREGIVLSLHGAVADLVWYLGPQTPVSEIINKLELIYGTVGSFDILMQYFFKLQQGKTEKVPVNVIHSEGTLDAVQQECLMMLSMSEVQKHLRDHLFHGLHKQWQDSMHYLYDDQRIMYLKPMTVAQKAESEQ